MKPVQPRIDLIVGARPNFMKVAPIIEALRRRSIIGYRLVHTGQHYDDRMSATFFEQLDIPLPDVNLGSGSGTQAMQTAAIMVGYERLLHESVSHACVVVGDVTSTLACSIVAAKANIPVAHVEGGIRSNDWSMPEEINRIVTDSITRWFFTTSEVANANLRKAGVSDDRIMFVGNTMIDTLLRHRASFRPPDFWKECNLDSGQYLVLTLHRLSNVDSVERLSTILKIIHDYASDPIVFPAHPRTARMLHSIRSLPYNLIIVEPQGYLEFNYLVSNARAVITDSGGVTEEATVLGVPCMTLRNSTERPETVTIGTNELLDTDPRALEAALSRLYRGTWKKGGVPPLWDGNTAPRIVEHLERLLCV